MEQPVHIVAECLQSEPAAHARSTSDTWYTPALRKMDRFNKNKGLLSISLPFLSISSFSHAKYLVRSYVASREINGALQPVVIG